MAHVTSPAKSKKRKNAGGAGDLDLLSQAQGLCALRQARLCEVECLG